MMNEKNPLTDQELDVIFDAVLRETPEVPENLTAAVLADAAETTADRQPVPARVRPKEPGWLALVLNGIGGWRGAATMAASGAFGLWIGYADLSTLPIVGDLSLQVDLMLNGDADLYRITTFDDFSLDG